MNVNWLVLSACVLLPLAAMAGAGQGSENVDPTRAPWAEAQAPWTNTAKPGDVVKDHVKRSLSATTPTPSSRAVR